jgi:hypothetical protein
MEYKSLDVTYMYIYTIILCHVTFDNLGGLIGTCGIYTNLIALTSLYNHIRTPCTKPSSNNFLLDFISSPIPWLLQEPTHAKKGKEGSMHARTYAVCMQSIKTAWPYACIL